MNFPNVIYRVIYFISDGKHRSRKVQYGNATDSLLSARELASECFSKNGKTQIIKSFVQEEVVHTYRPFTATLIVHGNKESFDSYDSLVARINELIENNTYFQFLGYAGDKTQIYGNSLR